VEIKLNCYRVYTQKQVVQSLCLHDCLDTISVNDEARKPLRCIIKAERDDRTLQLLVARVHPSLVQNTKKESVLVHETNIH